MVVCFLTLPTVKIPLSCRVFELLLLLKGAQLYESQCPKKSSNQSALTPDLSLLSNVTLTEIKAGMMFTVID